jgi:outer membrane protein TolC
MQLSLSDVLNISLQNMDVVRILTGVSATTTGRTVYDTAITNAGIDVARGAFDPSFNVNNSWLENRTPGAVPDPIDPTQTQILGTRNDRHALILGLSKRMVTGGVIDFGVIGSNNRFPDLITPLNPQIGSSAAVQLTQPLLQGAGTRVNQAPIVIARIDTERSYFQFKDAVQSHVQSVIQGYWQLVLARTELWAREQQVEQLEFALRRAEDRVEIGDARLGDLSQARVAYENFRAILLAAQANILQRESALRNVLGLNPYDNDRIIPTSPLIDEKVEILWEQLLSLAETNRPDIVELKLILEADQQRQLIRNNDALPRLDAVALYRWNGLEGTMPNGNPIRADGFDDWSLGVNFSVPIGLRASRALLRQQELLIQRDRVNLEQGLHQASHDLAISVRNLELFYSQYRRYQEVRKAAQENLDQQSEIGNELESFIVLLQAVVDWGNAVANEAQALVLYNAELAVLERETGTILETHGITFVEERFGSIGPLGRLAVPVAYPAATPATGLIERYPSTDQPSEQQLNLRDPLQRYEDNEDNAEDLPSPGPNVESDDPSRTSSRNSAVIRGKGVSHQRSSSSGILETLKNWLR